MFFSNNKNDKSNSNVLVYKNNVFPLHYQITQKTILTINNVNFNEIYTDIVWRVDNWQASESNYIVSLAVEKHDVTKCPEQMKALTTFLQLFNIPISNLLLQLNSQGLPIKVINQKEVYEKWLNLRNNELLDYDKDDTTKSIIAGGNVDFSNVLPVLLNSIPFVLFFSPIYGTDIFNKPNFQKINQSSQLFQGNNIETTLKCNATAISNLSVKLNRSGSGFIDDYGKAEKIFKNSYKQISDSDFDYGYNINAKFEYLRNGLLNTCLSEVKEQASNLIVSKQSYAITLIK
jgi:hypothetical protein